MSVTPLAIAPDARPTRAMDDASMRENAVRHTRNGASYARQANAQSDH